MDYVSSNDEANKFQIMEHYLAIYGVECILSINQGSFIRINTLTHLQSFELVLVQLGLFSFIQTQLALFRLI